MQSRHSKLYCLCSRDIQNFIVCAIGTFKTLLFVQSRHSKLYCLCSRDIQNFIVCAVATFKTLLFVQSRHSKLNCLCNRDIQNFIVCAVETFKTLLFVQLRHSKLYCLCSRAIRNFLVCVSLLGLRTLYTKNLYTVDLMYFFMFHLQVVNILTSHTGLELPNLGGTATLALTFEAKIGHQGNCQRHQGHTVIFRRAVRQNPR